VRAAIPAPPVERAPRRGFHRHVRMPGADARPA
jgi:hypothetical protein